MNFFFDKFFFSKSKKLIMLAYFANEPFNTTQIPPEVEVHFKGETPRRLSDHTIVIPEIFYLQPEVPGNLIARPSVLVRPDQFVFEPGQEVLVYKIAQHIASDRSSLISHYWLYIEQVFIFYGFSCKSRSSSITRCI